MNLFITLEGIEGAGKSTNLEYVRELLQQAGHDTLVTREPGGTALGERIRALLLDASALEISPEAETLLIFAARADHLGAVIRPALAAGRTVLCDRFTDATYAYQGGGRGVPREYIAVLEGCVHPGLRPHLTLLLDVPPATGLARAGHRSRPDRFEREDEGFFERTRAVYLQTAAAEPMRMRVIDATLSPQQVRAQIRAVLEEVLHANG